MHTGAPLAWRGPKVRMDSKDLGVKNVPGVGTCCSMSHVELVHPIGDLSTNDGRSAKEYANFSLPSIRACWPSMISSAAQIVVELVQYASLAQFWPAKFGLGSQAGEGRIGMRFGPVPVQKRAKDERGEGFALGCDVWMQVQLQLSALPRLVC